MKFLFVCLAVILGFSGMLNQVFARSYPFVEDEYVRKKLNTNVSEKEIVVSFWDYLLTARIDSPYLPLSGGTMSGDINLSITNSAISPTNKLSLNFQEFGTTYGAISMPRDGAGCLTFDVAGGQRFRWRIAGTDRMNLYDNGAFSLQGTAIFSGNVTAPTFIGNLSGNAATATYAHQWTGQTYNGSFWDSGTPTYILATDGTNWRPANSDRIKSFMGLGSASYLNTIYNSGFGYASQAYPTLVIKGEGNRTMALGYDPATNASGQFQGDGHEIVLRNGVEFITPNATNDNFYRNLLSLSNGEVYIKGQPFGANAFSSTAYLPLTGGRINGNLDVVSGAIYVRHINGYNPAGTAVDGLYLNYGTNHPVQIGGGGGVAELYVTGALTGTSASFTGNIGIGTNNLTEKLNVNGNIRARAVKVSTEGWPDYVFESTYKLPDLKATEQFIKENKHLPEVPSAKEVKTDGIELGHMNALLLKKIEELTLHLIQLSKKVDEQQAQIIKLKTSK